MTIKITIFHLVVFILSYMVFKYVYKTIRTVAKRDLKLIDTTPGFIEASQYLNHVIIILMCCVLLKLPQVGSSLTPLRKTAQIPGEGNFNSWSFNVPSYLVSKPVPTNVVSDSTRDPAMFVTHRFITHVVLLVSRI